MLSVRSFQATFRALLALFNFAVATYGETSSVGCVR